MPRKPVVIACSVLMLGCAALRAGAAMSAQTPPSAAGDYVINDFHFASGETLPELRLHYSVLGKPHRDTQGHVDNAILILHGTAGSGHGFLADRFAGALFGKGQLLDANRYFIILPDAIGHGRSSKPSDGLHARFPRYRDDDLVAAQYALVSDGLQVDHLRLVMGTSMGGMHAWKWGEMHPDFMDALMPMACLPVETAGRNRLWRTLIDQAIRSDPQWLEGDYSSEPTQGLRAAASILLLAVSAPLQLQASLSTPDAVDTFLQQYLDRELQDLDANDLLYQIDASRNVDASAGLEKIQAPVMWINFSDDFVNPPELGLAEPAIKRVKNGRFVLLPASAQTHGHISSGWPALWQSYLGQLLDSSKR